MVSWGNPGHKSGRGATVETILREVCDPAKVFCFGRNKNQSPVHPLYQRLDARQVLEDGDPTELAAALGDIARTRGMTQLAKDTGLSRESLYKSLSGERAPSSDTLFKVIRALGFKLTLQPVTPT